MSHATAAINTSERSGKIGRFPLAAAAVLFQGTLGALDSSGNAVRASDTAGLRVFGRIEHDADNTDGSAGDVSVDIKRGVFLFNNSATAAVDPDDKGKYCFVEDDNTVAETSTHKVKAGRVLDVTSDGVWVDTEDAHNVPSADTLTALTFSATVTAAEADAFRDAVLALLQAQGLVK